jgi:hypothetical protein
MSAVTVVTTTSTDATVMPACSSQPAPDPPHGDDSTPYNVRVSRLPKGVLDRDSLAARLGIDPGSVTRYVHRGDGPEPDGHIGSSPWWYEKTVSEWLANRPGRGAGGGRRKSES